MNTVQTRYAVAEAALKLMYDELGKLYSALPNKGTRVSEATRQRLHEAVSYDAVRAEHAAARRALLDWGKAVALRIASPNERADLAHMYDHIEAYPVQAEKLVKLTMRLRA